jgi:SAM-dependent methyltransferase
METQIECPLCNAETVEFRRFTKAVYNRCSNCNAVFKLSTFFPLPTEEKQRYEQHNNDVHDKGYQQFVSPIVQSILNDFLPIHKGLDFGAGPGPVITKLLRDNAYSIVEYDPYFWDYPELLEQTYDYIVCCEVMEHFQKPAVSFQLLYDLLKENGKLYCKTALFSDEIDFDKWYYKNDVTHVFFYTTETIEWIKNHFGFKSVSIELNQLVFTK